MKRLITSALALVLAVSLAACSGAAGFAQDADFSSAIESTREEELNQAFPIVDYTAGGEPVLSLNPNGMSKEEAASYAQMVADTIGLDGFLFERYSVSASLIITQAYAVGVFRPAEGCEEDALDAVNSYVDNVKKSFENYLPDQYDIAKQAVVRQYSSGEILLVLCENAPQQADALEKALSE